MPTRKEPGLVTTDLHGTVDLAAVEAWRDELLAVIAALPANTRFRLLADLTDYAYATLDSHKSMRVVVPGLLARTGFRTGLVDLVGAPEPAIGAERGVVCEAVAHVHHDRDKMSMYDTRIGRENERFFTSREAAEAWLRGLPARA